MQEEKEKLTEEIARYKPTLDNFFNKIGEVVMGSHDVASTLFMGILAQGHVLLEGLPGLAKTLLAETFANLVDLKFQRIQFTPDLLPADLTGGEIYRPQTGEFSVRRGPLFTNILLADEINRAPAKVQSALLEAMAERKITLGKETFQLDHPFLVIATQNPIEQEGTYPLPEAQIDRFMFKVLMSYPKVEDELKMLEVHGKLASVKINPTLSIDDIEAMRKVCESIFVDEKVKKYIVSLVNATREPAKYDEATAEYIEFGASPRASLALLKASRVIAFFEGRAFVIPEDVDRVALEVLRHRIILSYAALAEDIDGDLIVKSLIQKVEVL